MVKSRDGREHSGGMGNMDQHGPRRNSDPKLEDMSVEGNSWAMEVYKGDMDMQDRAAVGTEDEGMLEFDLDDEETEAACEVMAIAVFYSRKSYSSQFLFSDMLKAWNIQQLAEIEKIGDYIFKLEFNSP
jgi:hypothetical protein